MTQYRNMDLHKRMTRNGSFIDEGIRNFLITQIYLKNNCSSKNKNNGGFPGGAVVENLPVNAGDTGSSPGLGRSHMPRSD